MSMKNLRNCITTSIFVFLYSTSLAYSSQEIDVITVNAITEQTKSVANAIDVLKVFAQTAQLETKAQKLRNIAKHLIASKHMQTVKSIKELSEKDVFAKLAPLIIFGVCSNDVDIDFLENSVMELARFYSMKEQIKKITNIIELYPQGFFDTLKYSIQQNIAAMNTDVTDLEKILEQKKMNLEGINKIKQSTQQLPQDSQQWKASIVNIQKDIAKICVQIDNKQLLQNAKNRYVFFNTLSPDHLQVETFTNLEINALNSALKAIINFSDFKYILKSINLTKLKASATDAVNMIKNQGVNFVTKLAKLTTVILEQQNMLQLVQKSNDVNDFGNVANCCYNEDIKNIFNNAA